MPASGASARRQLSLPDAADPSRNRLLDLDDGVDIWPSPLRFLAFTASVLSLSCFFPSFFCFFASRVSSSP